MAWYWWLTWSALAAGTLVGGFFLGRWLWRRAVALGRELARAGEVTGRLVDRADELAEAARARRPVPPVALGRDPAGPRAQLAAVRAERDARADARALRHRETWRRWVEHWR